MTHEYSGGAVLHTVINNQIYYVLVVERNGDCGLPKGHLEQRETAEEAALREIREETGVNAELWAGFREQVSYLMGNGNKKHVTYFIASYQNQPLDWSREELCGIRCLPYRLAIRTLTHTNVKQILAKAHPVILQRNGIPGFQKNTM